MSKTIEFIFDFGSPNAYLSYYRDPGRRAHGRDTQDHSCLLGGIFKSTITSHP